MPAFSKKVEGWDVQRHAHHRVSALYIASVLLALLQPVC